MRTNDPSRGTSRAAMGAEHAKPESIHKHDEYDDSVLVAMAGSAKENIDFSTVCPR
jgi:hypothetical protein